MKLLKTALVGTGIAAAMMLTACDAGSHGFEGKYSVEPTPAYDAKLKMFEKSEMTASVAQQIRSNLAAIDAELGTDYLMLNGNRIEAERVFVREQEGKSYLVADTPEGEDVFPIIDSDKKVLQIDGEMLLVWESEL